MKFTKVMCVAITDELFLWPRIKIENSVGYGLPNRRPTNIRDWPIYWVCLRFNLFHYLHNVIEKKNINWKEKAAFIYHMIQLS